MALNPHNLNINPMVAEFWAKVAEGPNDHWPKIWEHEYPDIKEFEFFYS